MFKGSVLREAREKAGYTLLELAEALKKEYGTCVVDFTTLSQWEINPNASPRKGNIKRVAAFLNVPLSQLYEETESKSNDESINVLLLIEKLIKIHKENPEDERLKKIELILM